MIASHCNNVNSFDRHIQSIVASSSTKSSTLRFLSTMRMRTGNQFSFSLIHNRERQRAVEACAVARTHCGAVRLRSTGLARGCFHRHRLPEHLRYFRHANAAYIAWAVDKGFRITPSPVIFQLYSEPMQRMRLAARGHGRIVPPAAHRRRVETYFDPLPFWYAAEEEGEARFPMHALTQRPMAMYHSWGSQNAWLRQIHTANRLFMSRARAAELGIADDDWVWITSRIGRVKAQVRLMEGVNADTVWTWNAVAKRAGAWGLSPKAPEATRAFLLNHLIAELLPEQPGGHRYSNSDPVTGQAAWYDLRVRIERADNSLAETAPRFAPLVNPSAGPTVGHRPQGGWP